MGQRHVSLDRGTGILSVELNQLAGTAAHKTDLRMLDGIAGWCGGLHGSMALNETLGALAAGCGATAGAIARHSRGEHLPRSVAIYDSQSKAEELPTLKRPLTRDAMGYMYSKAKPSTVWFMTDLLDDAAWSGTQILHNWRLAREVAEIVIISLAGTQNRDFIEFHFTRLLEHSEKLEFEALTPIIVRSWAGRKKGLVAESLMGGRKTSKTAPAPKRKWQDPVLSVANPAGLSRAEFRVCLMLSKGLSVKGVVQELGTSEATVRSHLRSIYSKTEAHGMAELLYLILSNEESLTLLPQARSA